MVAWMPACTGVLPRARAGVAALALVCMAVPAWAQAPNLAAIPVEPAGPGAPVPATAALRVRVHVGDPAGLARLLGLAGGGGATAGLAGTMAPGLLELQLVPGAHPEVPTPADALAASFIVDHGEPAVLRLSDALRAAAPGSPVDAAAVTAFVAQRMQGSVTANASLASQVALTLRGDCTEYALLTAALARRTGIPARIVHGAVLLQIEGHWLAYGHAWVQTLEAGRWTVRDSALASQPGPVYYLPAAAVTDEGPGYMLGLLQGFRLMPSHIEVLGAMASSR